ncbi:MAG TPA: hypothetical protein VG099_30390, partial [Gemmataceae bacterium]|nr:hypothetical protein [Gemmataceae bacterium]
MTTAQEKDLFVPSTTYNVVRCRQLEGTFPGAPETGCWPITSLRVMRGWGSVPQDAWPDTALESWPPREPPGLDEIAKGQRVFRYQRIRTAHECWLALQARKPVMASFEITRQWFDAAGGVIPVPEENTPVLGSHMVTIVGADEN